MNTVALLGLVMWAGAAPPSVDPPMTVRELRKEVDPAARWTPEVVAPNQNGWNLAMKAATLHPRPRMSLDSAGMPGAPPPKPSAGETIYDVITAMDRPGEINLVRRGERVLKPYGPALKLLAQAAARPRWAPPEPRDDVVPNGRPEMILEFPEFAGLKDLAKALVLRARVRLKEGRPAQAANDLLLAHSVGTHMIESHKNLITLLVGVAICSIADRPIQRLVRDPAWSHAQLRRLQAGLRGRRIGVDFAASMRHEFDGGLLRTIAGIKPDAKDLGTVYGSGPGDDISKLISANPHPFDRRDTVRYGSRMLARIVGAMGGPWPELKAVTNRATMDSVAGSSLASLPTSGTQGVPQEQIDKVAEAARKETNPAGRLLVSIVFPVYAQTAAADRKSIADLAATHVALAAAMYKHAHGREAPTLRALVKAGFLSSIPKDPFGNAPMRYDAARRVVWSVGPDGKDDGGRDIPGRFSGEVKDYVWPTDGVFNRG